VMPTCYATSASALVRIAWRSSCGPPTGGALGPAAASRLLGPPRRLRASVSSALWLRSEPSYRWRAGPFCHPPMPICISHHLRTHGTEPPVACLLPPGRAAAPACVAFAREAAPASWWVCRGRPSLGCEYVAAARRIRRSCKWET